MGSGPTYNGRINHIMLVQLSFWLRKAVVDLSLFLHVLFDFILVASVENGFVNESETKRKYSANYMNEDNNQNWYEMV